MRRISLHIEYLIRTHDCVVVPGMGAFLAHIRPARFDADTMTIYPAAREICFNASIIHNDGIIASSIVRKEGISYSEALRIIEEEATEIKQAVINNETVKIGNIGTLSSNSEGQILFTPYRNEEALGFEPVQLARQIEPSTENEEETPDYIIRRKGYWYLPIPKTATKVAASLLLLAAIAISFILPGANEKRLPDKASVIPVDKIEMPVKKPELKEETIISQPQTQPKAYLIVATFKTEKQARKFIDSNAGANLELVPGGTVYRVSAAKAETAEELRSTLNSRRFKNQFSEAWIWISPESR